MIARRIGALLVAVAYDLMVLGGVALLALGAGMIHPAGAWIVLGGSLLLLGLLLGIAEERRRLPPEPPVAPE